MKAISIMNITYQLIHKQKPTETVLDKKFSTFRERVVYDCAHKKKSLVTAMNQMKYNLKYQFAFIVFIH